MRTALALALALAVSSAVAVARAQDARPVVVLVRPEAASELVDEMLGRTRAELAAAGFDARIVEGTPGAAPRAAIEGADARAIAAIAIVDPEGEATVEIWVDDRLSGKMSIRGLVANETDRHKAASVLAIQAVELLRASLVEIARTDLPQPSDRPAPPPRPPPPPAAVAFAREGLPAAPPPAPAREPRAELSLAAGPAAFIGFDPALVDVAPSFALALTAPSGLGGRVRFTGPGWGPEVDVDGGGVSLSPWVLTAGALWAPRSAGRWFGYLALDAGVFQLDADGVLAPPATSREGSAFAAALLGGGGGGLRLTDSIAVILEAELMVTAPRISVVVGGDPVATAGRPWALTTLALQLTR